MIFMSLQCWTGFFVQDIEVVPTAVFGDFCLDDLSFAGSFSALKRSWISCSIWSTSSASRLSVSTWPPAAQVFRNLLDKRLAQDEDQGGCASRQGFAKFLERLVADAAVVQTGGQPANHRRASPPTSTAPGPLIRPNTAPSAPPIAAPFRPGEMAVSKM